MAASPSPSACPAANAACDASSPAPVSPPSAGDRPSEDGFGPLGAAGPGDGRLADERFWGRLGIGCNGMKLEEAGDHRNSEAWQHWLTSVEFSDSPGSKMRKVWCESNRAQVGSGSDRCTRFVRQGSREIAFAGGAADGDDQLAFVLRTLGEFDRGADVGS